VSASSCIFELRQVTKQFGKSQVLSGINLQVQAGERVALVGPSGAGKSTLISLLNGTQLSTQGEVYAFGYSLARLSPRQRRHIQRQIGTVYQQFHLVDNLQVIHNVNAGHLGYWSLPKAILSLLRPLEVKTAAQALAQVGIPEKLYERTDRLSGGEQQRVALARVLVQNPIAILADEPIASLDPERSREILDLLRDMNKQTGKTLLISLHAIELACHYCHRIVGLRQGKILFDAPSQEVMPEMVAALYRIEDTGERATSG